MALSLEPRLVSISVSLEMFLMAIAHHTYKLFRANQVLTLDFSLSLNTKQFQSQKVHHTSYCLAQNHDVGLHGLAWILLTTRLGSKDSSLV